MLCTAGLKKASSWCVTGTACELTLKAGLRKSATTGDVLAASTLTNSFLIVKAPGTCASTALASASNTDRADVAEASTTVVEEPVVKYRWATVQNPVAATYDLCYCKCDTCVDSDECAADQRKRPFAYTVGTVNFYGTYVHVCGVQCFI